MSNFNKTREFHQFTGLPDYDHGEHKNWIQDKPLCDFRLKLIEEEVNELKDAINNKDTNEVIDALSDILYVVYGTGASFGIDLDKTFDIVHKSNMSKMCKTEKEAQDSVLWYKVNRSDRYDTPTYRTSIVGGKTVWIVYNESDGKILKSINWKPPVF